MKDQMKPSPRRWPNPEQILLLRAALLQGDDSLTAWQAWRINADFDRLPPGGFGLLPMLAYNLKQQGINDPLLDTCHGIHRRTWAQNQTYLRSIAALVQGLQESDSAYLLMGDILLAMVYYPAPGLRNISHNHLLTPAIQTDGIQAQLKQAGWQPQPAKRRLDRFMTIAYGQAQRYQPPGQELALHWHCLPTDSTLAFPPDIWQNSQRFTVNGMTIRGVDPTNLLLWICSQGLVQCWRDGAVQWLADAFMLLRTTLDEIDWPRLLTVATQRTFTFRMRTALETLHQYLDTSIPRSVLQTLATRPVQPIEAWEAKLYMRLPRTMGQLLALWSAYQRRNIPYP
ncbi:MAG: nucleotidyltransferase family protein [Caldilineaceae bacterium]